MSRSQYQKIFISRDNKIHSIEPGGRQNRSVFGIAKLLNSLFHLVRWRFRHYQRTFHCPANKKRQIKLFHPDPQTQTWALYKKRIRMVKFSSSGQKKRRFRNHQRPAKDIIRFRGGGQLAFHNLWFGFHTGGGIMRLLSSVFIVLPAGREPTYTL